MICFVDLALEASSARSTAFYSTMLQTVTKTYNFDRNFSDNKVSFSGKTINIRLHIKYR